MTEPILERTFLSQYSIEDLGVVIHKAGVLANVDAVMTATFVRTDPNPATVFTRPATHTATGVYEVSVSSVETQMPGLYEMRWTFALNTISQLIVGYVEIGTPAPDYDNLTPGSKAIVEDAWHHFSDLFDSPEGGPNLMTYFQSKFGRNRMAQLLGDAYDVINGTGQPVTSYVLGNPQGEIGAQWGGLVKKALRIEIIMHLIRSYTEQPSASFANIAMLDRRDYMDRWTADLKLEEETFKTQLDTFKIAHMNLGRGRVLVAGGAYGNYGPTRLPASVVARPRFLARFY